MSRGTHVTATRQLQSGPPLTSRGAPSRSRNGNSGGIKPTANIPRESHGPRGSLTQHLQSCSTASPQHSSTRPCGPNRPGRPLPSPGPANARRWPRWDRRPAITPPRESRGRSRYPCTPQSPGCTAGDGRDVPAGAASPNPTAAGPKLRACPPFRRRKPLAVDPRRCRCRDYTSSAGAARPRPGTLLDPEGSHFPGEGGGQERSVLRNQLMRTASAVSEADTFKQERCYISSRRFCS